MDIERAQAVSDLMEFQKTILNSEKPIAQGYIWAKSATDDHAALVKLSLEDWCVYPVEVDQVVRRNRLFSHFKCYAKWEDQRELSANTSLPVEKIQEVVKYLKTQEKTNPVIEWNKTQLLAAFAFAKLPQDSKKGVPDKVMVAFHQGPDCFRQALKAA